MSASNLNSKKKFVIFSVILIIFGAISTIAGGVFMYLNAGNDSEGYALSNTYTINTSANAFGLLVASPSSGAQLKWVIHSLNSKEVFAGWGAESVLGSYSNQYKFATPIYGWNYHASYYASIKITSVEIINQDKPAMPRPLAGMLINQGTSADSTTLYCTRIDEADSMGAIIVMNADGSNGVNATIQLGSKIAVYGWLPYLLIPMGVVLIIIGMLLFKRSTKQPRNQA